MNLVIHSFLPVSFANGPGARAVVWVQGCSLGCPGCFNPETHSFGGGSQVTVGEMFDSISALGDRIEGVTLSGGEPLQQLEAVSLLLRRIKTETSLSAIVFTGFTWDEVVVRGPDLLECVDAIITGRYEENHRVARGLRGSANKTIHLLTNRYEQKDFEEQPSAEVVLEPDGNLILSGIDPVRWCDGG